MRFRGLDQNNDGAIARSEWRGSERAFRNHDWNNDGVLSGDEVRAGAQRPSDPAWQADDFDEGFTDWTPTAFSALDRNGDNRITKREWQFEAEAFARADHNGDNVVTRAEFLSEDVATSREAQPYRQQQQASIEGRFKAWDDNGDGRLSRTEWQGTRERFDRLDANRDGLLTAGEIDNRNTNSVQTRAYRAGYERGLAEGRQAGREDGQRNQWDLDGQRELEQADSGYQPAHGNRAEYQSGYRDGFRRAYGEQWETTSRR